MSLAPATIESSHPMLPQPADRVYKEEDIVLNCVVSGTQRGGIEWLKNGQTIHVNKDDRYAVRKTQISGYFSYGQNGATKFSLILKMGSSVLNCAEMDNYLGEYSCKSSESSDILTRQLSLQCK